MKKNILLFISFFIIWAIADGACYLLEDFLQLNWSTKTHNYFIIGFACAMGCIFGPILAAYLDKIFKKKKD